MREGLSLWTGNTGLSMVMRELSLEYQRVRDLKDVLSHHLAVGGSWGHTLIDRCLTQIRGWGQRGSESEPVADGFSLLKCWAGASTTVRQSQGCSQWQMVLGKMGSKIIIYPFGL